MLTQTSDQIGGLPTRTYPGVFVTGTDTDVGKTLVAAILTLGLGARYWKPVQSGKLPRTDLETVRQLTELPEECFWPERFCLTHPLSPHAAAAADGVHIDLQDFALPPSDRPWVVEGAGGLMVPLNDRHYILDLIQHLGLPVVLVARTQLGTLNHTFLSLAQLRRSGIPVLGVVLNGPDNPSNRETIAHHGQIPILGEIPPLRRVFPEVLHQVFQQCPGLVHLNEVLAPQTH